MTERFGRLAEKVDALEDRMSAAERSLTLAEEALVRLATTQERIAVTENGLSRLEATMNDRLGRIENLIHSSREIGRVEKEQELTLMVQLMQD